MCMFMPMSERREKWFAEKSNAPTGPTADAIQGDWSVTIAGIRNQDGTLQFDTFRDVALTANVSNNSLTVFDGCTDWTARFQLTDGEFTLIEPFTSEDRGPNCTTRHAPLTDILENIRHVATHDTEVYMHLDNCQIAVILEAVDN